MLKLNQDEEIEMIQESQLNEANKRKISKNFLKWFDKHFFEKDLIDLNAFYDITCTISENQNIFMDKFADSFIEGKERNIKLKELAEEKKKLDFNERKEQFESDINVNITFVK